MGHTLALCGARVDGALREAQRHAATCAACGTLARQDEAGALGPAPGSLSARQETAEHAVERLGSYIEHLSSVRSSGRQVGLLATAIAACERALWMESNGRVGYQFSHVTGVLAREADPTDQGLRAQRHRQREERSG